jgi:hypothetical protein
MQRPPTNEERLRAFGIEELSYDELHHRKAFIVGNDPFMGPKLDKYVEPRQKIALIATSGMRAISLACKLGNPQQVPHIYLVDYSNNVYLFWLALRDFFERHDNAASFMEHFSDFLSRNGHIISTPTNENYAEGRALNKVKFLNQNPRVFIDGLIKKYPYDYVRDVVLHATVIRQDWRNIEFFCNLNRYIRAEGIEKTYIYASNIVACMAPEEWKNQALEGIQCTNPVVAIHTSYSHKYQCPKYVYILEDSEPEAVKRAIFPKGANFSGKPKFSDHDHHHHHHHHDHHHGSTSDLLRALFEGNNISTSYGGISISFCDLRELMMGEDRELPFVRGQASVSEPVTTSVPVSVMNSALEAVEQPEPEMVVDFSARDSILSELRAYRSIRECEFVLWRRGKLSAVDALIDVVKTVPANVALGEHVRNHTMTLTNHLKELTDSRLGKIYAAVLASVEVAERPCKKVVVRAL